MKKPQSPAERQEALRRFAELGKPKTLTVKDPDCPPGSVFYLNTQVLKKGIDVADVLEIFPGARGVATYGPGQCPICNQKGR